MVLWAITLSIKNSLLDNIYGKQCVLGTVKLPSNKLSCAAARRLKETVKLKEQNAIQGADVPVIIPLFSDLSK